METFYHINGILCIAVKEEHKKVLRDLGWRNVPFAGVPYPAIATLQWNKPYYGPWVLKLPKCPLVTEQKKEEPKEEKKEEPKTEDRSPIIKRRGRPKKKKE